MLRIVGETQNQSTGSLPIDAVTQVVETPHQLALQANLTGALSADTVGTVRYKVAGTSTWKSAHPLYLSPGAYFAGCIFNLDPGVSYEVEVVFNDGSVQDVRTNTFTTRALPDAAGPPNKPANTSNAQSTLDGAAAGDVIELAAGSYGRLTISAGGNPGNPVYVRGADIDGTVLQQYLTIAAPHVVVENLTIEGPGTSMSIGSEAIRLEDGAHFVTMRDIKATGLGMGVKTKGGGTSTNITNNVLMYNCEIIGGAPWTSAGLTTSTYWSEDGVRLVGHGNCVWGCTIQGFGDAVTFAHSQASIADQIYGNFAYENFVRNSVDDCFELDYSQRLVAVYDNYCENIKTAWSQSDDSFLGPLYIFRNVFVNVGLRPIKPNTDGQGFHVYSNTWIKADAPDGTYTGDSNRGRFLYDDNPTGQHNRFAWRNNLMIYRGSKVHEDGHGREFWHARWGNTITLINVDWSHNAHYPDLPIHWSDEPKNYATLAEAIAANDHVSPLYPAAAGLGAPAKRYTSDSKITVADPFVTPITTGADALTEVTGKIIPAIASGQTPKNAGVEIPGITDDYSGPAPDIGAIIAGRPAVSYGASFA